ncbi:MAG TPA: lactate utilization protein [Xanthobacteraceae bacterium]|jgi:L-lactate dehydrogenase complex protein LldG|nr:lactate utilization protein [Xanthobacteraceae bacterium]
MSARDLIFGSIRRSLGVSGKEATRRKTVDDRLAQHPAGLIPARGQLAPKQRLALFRTMVEAANGSVEEIADAGDVPGAIAALLRTHNLPMAVRRGADPRLAALPWERARTLEVAVGPTDGKDLAAVSHAFGAVAESGTLMLVSGPDNPTTLNFLPDTHIVIVDAKDVAGDYETLWRRLRETFGDGLMPRTVNLITGPSRSADIEQTLILGAHGPRRLHVVLVGAAEEGAEQA